MPLIESVPKKNVWDAICSDFEYKQVTETSHVENKPIDFDPSIHSPVFYGYHFEQNKLDDESLLKDFDASKANPACFGYSLTETKSSPQSKTAREANNQHELNQQSKNSNEANQENIDKLTEKEYIEKLVFPVLLPALEEMLARAKQNRCFERKRTAFNACDFLTEYLYKNNPFKQRDESNVRKALSFMEIPFVKNYTDSNPRPPLPKSLIWTEEEAAMKIQAFYRGYLVRRDPEVQELRIWQRELREENQNIVVRVEQFWNDSASQRNEGSANTAAGRSATTNTGHVVTTTA